MGYRALTDERELLEHRVGPWLRDDAPLPALAAVSRRAGWGWVAVLPHLVMHACS